MDKINVNPPPQLRMPIEYASNSSLRNYHGQIEVILFQLYSGNGNTNVLIDQVEENTENIELLTIRVEDLEIDVAELFVRVGDNETDITTLFSITDDLEIRVSQNEDDIVNLFNITTGLDARVTQNELDIAQNTSDIAERIRHTGAYVEGQEYNPFDETLDGGYLANCISTTTDRPAPQRIGEQTYLYSGTLSNSNVNAKQVIAGQRYSSPTPYLIEGYRVYTVTGNNYAVYSVLDPTGSKIPTLLAEFTAGSTGWQTISISSSIVSSNTKFDLLVVISEPDPTPTETTLSYNYLQPQNFAGINNGELVQPRSTTGLIYVSKFDQNGDQDAFLSTLTVGDTFMGAGVNWSIQSAPVDGGTYYLFSVAPSQLGTPTGIQDFIFTTNVATPITYANEANYWVLNPDIQGVFTSTGGLFDVVPDDNFYLVDILVQGLEISPDWFIKSYSDVLGSVSDSGVGSRSASPTNAVIESLGPSTTTQNFLLNPVLKVSQSLNLEQAIYKVTLSFEASASATNRRVAAGLYINGVLQGGAYEKEPKDTNDNMYVTKVFRFEPTVSGFNTFEFRFGCLGGGGGNSVTTEQVTIFVERL